MTGIGHYRYEGFDLREKVGWVRDAAGATAFHGIQDVLDEISRELVDGERRLRAAVRAIGGEWDGGAAGSAGEALRGLSVWTGDSAAVTNVVNGRVEIQADVVARTRHGMPEVESDSPSWDDSGNATFDLVDIHTDQDERQARLRAANEIADRVLREHESATRANLQALPTLPEVPATTVITARKAHGPGVTAAQDFDERSPMTDAVDDMRDSYGSRDSPRLDTNESAIGGSLALGGGAMGMGMLHGRNDTTHTNSLASAMTTPVDAPRGATGMGIASVGAVGLGIPGDDPAGPAASACEEDDPERPDPFAPPGDDLGNGLVLAPSIIGENTE